MTATYLETKVIDKYGISERTVRHYCAEGKIEEAFSTGKTWMQYFY